MSPWQQLLRTSGGSIQGAQWESGRERQSHEPVGTAEMLARGAGVNGGKEWQAC